jgi:hypothetical protein
MLDGIIRVAYSLCKFKVNPAWCQEVPNYVFLRLPPNSFITNPLSPKIVSHIWKNQNFIIYCTVSYGFFLGRASVNTLSRR